MTRDLDAARGVINGVLLGAVLWLLILVGIRSLSAQVAPRVELRRGAVTSTLVRNPSRDTVAVTVELLGALPALGPVAALVSPPAFTLAPAEEQVVRVKLRAPISAGTVLRLRTCLTPATPALRQAARGVVARVTLRTCVLAKAEVVP